MDANPPTAVVSGGSRGIGRALSEAFVAAGYRVVVGARRESGVASAHPDQLRFVTADARRAGDHRKLVEAALEWSHRLDVYVNNAGASGWRPIEKADDAFVDHMLETNLKSVLWGCQAAARGMTRGGSIINVSSLAGKRGSANNAIYCATKFAVNGITQSLAKELGARQIRVNAVCPVLVRTAGLVEALADADSPARGDIDAFLEAFNAQNSALGRLPNGAEVAGACLFLASNAASAITGQCLNIDCGVFPQ